MPAKRARPSRAKTLRNAEPGPSAAKGAELLTPETGLDNEGFVIDLFLDRQRQVRLTQILHVKTNDGDAWEGWDESRLINFFISRANLYIAEPEAERALDLADELDRVSLEPVEKSADVDVTIEAESLASNRTPVEIISLDAQSEPHATLVDHGVEIIPLDAQSATRCITQGEPFNVRLLLADQNFARTGKDSLDFRVAVSAIMKGRNSKFFLAAEQGELKSTDRAIQIVVPRQQLERGIYSIAADIEVSAPGASAIAAWNLRSRLLQII